MIVFALIFRWSIHVCNRFKKKKNCRWSWWSIHLRNIYFIKKKNRRKRKHCSVIVFALIFWWSIHVCNRLLKKNCRWSWWSIHLRNIYFIKKKNRRKKKHCSVIVFALIFWWSIHVSNTFERKKNHWWSWWSIHLRNIYFIIKKIVARRSTVRWLSLLWYFDGQYTCIIHLKKIKIVDGHDGQYTCVIIILFKKKIVARRSTVRWLSLLWYFDGQYTCVIHLKKKKLSMVKLVMMVNTLA